MANKELKQYRQKTRHKGRRRIRKLMNKINPHMRERPNVLANAADIGHAQENVNDTVDNESVDNDNNDNEFSNDPKIPTGGSSDGGRLHGRPWSFTCTECDFKGIVSSSNSAKSSHIYIALCLLNLLLEVLINVLL